VRLASVGYDVTIGSRAEERARQSCDALLARWPQRGLRLSGGDNAAAAAADVVVVATPWDAAAATVTDLAGALAGKVVISMGNALVKVARGELQAVALARGSVAATVQAAAPRAFVAAAFHHLPAKELGELDQPVDCDVLVCSDHAVATSTTAELASKIPGVRVLDAGRLANAGTVESFVAVLIDLNVRYKTHTALRITGVEV
jgi:hypothetical protein